MNRLHAEGACRREILLAIVDEDAARGICLGHAKDTLVDLTRRLAHTEPTGAEEDVEERAETEMPNAVLVQLARLVVECRQTNPCWLPANALTQPTHHIEALRPGRAETEHELLELVAREVARSPEDGDVQVLVE